MARRYYDANGTYQGKSTGTISNGFRWILWALFILWPLGLTSHWWAWLIALPWWALLTYAIVTKRKQDAAKRAQDVPAS